LKIIYNRDQQEEFYFHEVFLKELQHANRFWAKFKYANGFPFARLTVKCQVVNGAKFDLQTK